MLIVARATATSAVAPVSGTSYTADNSWGNNSVGYTTGTGNYVVYNGSGTSVNVTGLLPGASYTFDIYEYNNTDVCYKTPAFSNTVSTLNCSPPSPATSLTPSGQDNTHMNVAWSGGGGTHTLVVVRLGGSPTAPTNGLTYTGATGSSIVYSTGQALGTGRIIYNGPGSSGNVTVTGLTLNQTYSYDVYSYNLGPSCYASSYTGTGITTNKMSFVSSTTTQNNADVNRNTSNQMIVGLQVVTAGATAANVVNTITFSTTGTSDVINDITNAKIYYTGTSSTFSPSGLFGTQVSPGTGGTIFGSQTLSTGTNYFWLTYDIPAGASYNHFARAAITEFVVTNENGGVKTPANTTSATRVISPSYCAVSGGYSGSNASITNFRITNTATSAIVLNNSNGTLAGGYQNFASSITLAELTQGTQYTFSITRVLDLASSYGIRVWIDYDDDGQFGNNTAAYSGIELLNSAVSNTSATQTFNYTIPTSGISAGPHRLRVRNVYNTTNISPCGSVSYGEAEDYLVNIIPPNMPMSFVSNTTTQNNTLVGPGTTNQQIVGLQIVTSGSLSPFNLSSISFNTTGSTAPLTDMANAKIYYTGTSPVFSAVNQFGNIIASPNGSYTITGMQELSQGTNYFWLAFDCLSAAALGNFVSAAITSIVMDGAGAGASPLTSTATASRMVGIPYCFPQTGGYYWTGSQNNGMITNVTITNTATSEVIFNNSAPNPVMSPILGFDDQTYISPPDLVPGIQYTFSITRSIDGSSNYITKAYLDVGNDGTFADVAPDFIYDSGDTGPGTPTRTFTYTIPSSGISPGLHRLRIRNRNDDLNDDPCDSRTNCGLFCGFAPIYGETEDYLVNIVPDEIVWTGTSGTDWNTAGNWNTSTVPGTGSTVRIPNTTNKPVIAGVNPVLADMELESNAVLTVVFGNILTVNGLLTNNGQLRVNNGASLVQGASSTLAGSGSYLVQRQGHTGGTSYNFWSSPVSNGPLSALGGNNRYTYNPALGTATTADDQHDPGWVTATGTMLPGKGYVSTGAGLVTFTGMVNNHPNGSPLEVSVGRQLDVNNDEMGLNLVGNPFPSPVNVISFLGDNAGVIDGTIWLWSQSTTPPLSSSDYATINYLGAVGGGGAITPVSGAEAFIPSMQGFFVNKSALGTANIQFRNSQRSAASNTQFFNSGDIARVYLGISGPDQQNDELLIGFKEDASDGFDPLYDGPKMNLHSERAFYSLMGDRAMAIQGFPPLNGDRSVNLGFKSTKAGQYHIRRGNTEGLEPGTELLLEDLLTGQFHDLSTGSEYVFVRQPNDPDNRFRLHFYPGVETSVQAESCKGGDGQLSLYNPSQRDRRAVVLNAAGTEVYSADLPGGDRMPVSGLTPGMYLLQVLSGESAPWLQSFTIETTVQTDAGFITQPEEDDAQRIHFIATGAGPETSLYWELGDGTVAEGRQVSHRYGQPGIYGVVLWADNGQCGSNRRQDIVVLSGEMPTGITAPENTEDVYWYPNPARDWLNVKLPAPVNKPVTVELFSLTGQRVLHTTLLASMEAIQVSHLPEGLYLVKLTAGDGRSVTERVVITR